MNWDLHDVINVFSTPSFRLNHVARTIGRKIQENCHDACVLMVSAYVFSYAYCIL